MTDKARKKRPRDPNQLGKLIVDISVGEVEEPVTKPKEKSAHGKDPAAVSLGRRGGLKGGKARAKKLTAQQRSSAAKLPVPLPKRDVLLRIMNDYLHCC